MTDIEMKDTAIIPDGEQDQEERRDRPPPARQGRVIVRNLVFDMREKHLQKAFSKFGKIESIDVPLNNTNNQNRGFGFIEFSSKGEAQGAINAMNASMFKGRPLTVEFSLPKASYETKVQHVLDNTNQTKQDVIKPKSIKLEDKKKAEDDANTPAPA
jgi:RNA recognition motif-containing protein